MITLINISQLNTIMYFLFLCTEKYQSLYINIQYVHHPSKTDTFEKPSLCTCMKTAGGITTCAY